MLCEWLQISAQLSTAFHSETDEQIKIANTIMKQYLQMYCSYLQDDWEKWLSLTEFTANNTTNESTDVTPFYVIYKQDSWIEFEPQTEIDESAQFKLLIKWKEYEQRTWKPYMMIKKDAPEGLKEFHEDHPSRPAPAGWIKEENKWLPPDTWNMNTQNTWTQRERFWRKLPQNLDIQNFFFFFKSLV